MKDNLTEVMSGIFVIIFFSVMIYCIWQAHDTANRAIELCYNAQPIPTVSYD